MVLITESKLRSMINKGIPNPFVVREGDKLTPAAADFLRDRRIPIQNMRLVKKDKVSAGSRESLQIPVGVSNRHVHLAPEDVSALFGEGYSLMPLRELSQPGQFAAKEQVTLVGPKGIIQNVRILGPARGETQVEISNTDGYQLGIHPPTRLSGWIEDTPGLTLVGPKGCISLQKGVIVAKRHIHISDIDAQKYSLKDGDCLYLQSEGERQIIFADVMVRIHPNYRLDFHVDMDEGNAAGLKTGDMVKLIGKKGVFFSNREG
ncbi:phosphate propanoyltransferase [Neobacillus mesonae]|uniref:phosphate propanoyltransferase n=1 Tax=Neobacillus mesonae TaxID=1193713 RepID=UPI0025730D4D|nr:phosphate propanoyltransferase [Neobacillus mesonae]